MAAKFDKKILQQKAITALQKKEKIKEEKTAELGKKILADADQDEINKLVEEIE